MPLNLPFRNFTTFRSYWIREGASGHGGWQARRDIVEELLDPFRQELTRQRRSGTPQISEELIATLRDPAAIREQLGRLQRMAAQGLAWRLLSANVVIALRKRLLQAQRNCTARCLPDALVTGVHPASAATESGPS